MPTTRTRCHIRTSRPLPVRAGRAAVLAGFAALGLALAAGAARGQGEHRPPEPAAEALSAPDRPAPASRATRPARPATRRNRVAEAARPASAPADLSDLGAWLEYRVRSRHFALPLEARAFHRRGVLARQGGSFEEAVRLVRGAAELDPHYAAPHLTLVRWYLTREPGQALHHAAGLVDVARRSFAFQLQVAANAAAVLVQALFLALLAAGLVLVLVRNAEIRHPLEERLVPLVGPGAARRWPWALLAVPFLAGLGLALPTLFFLAVLWPVLKGRERTVFVALGALLLAMPRLAVEIDRFAAPQAADRAPLHGVATLPGEPVDPGHRARLAALADRHPDQPLLRFGVGWLAQQEGDLAAAEQAYREARALRPDDDRLLNNLANTLALQGRTDEAMELYRRAIQIRPDNAAPHFNLSQLHTRRFDYHAATDALARASALDFEMVKSRQAETQIEGHLPLVDQWIAPRDLWAALLLHRPEAARAAGIGPWRGAIELGGAPFVAATLLAAVLGLALGMLQHRACPVRRCSNCDRVVCRRCAERRRELALCRGCAAVDARAQAADFARLLLLEHRQRSQRWGRIARTTAAALIPGYGLLALRRVGPGFVLLVLAATLALLAGPLPFAYEPRAATLERFPWVALLLPWAAIYASSVLGYLGEQSRQDARAALPARAGRPRPAPPRLSQAA